MAAISTRIYNPYGVTVDASGNVYIADQSNSRVRFAPKRSGMYFGQTMTANYIYTIGGTGNKEYNGENAAATVKNIIPTGVFSAPDHGVYLTSGNKIRMVAGEDFIAPSTSTLEGYGTSTAGEVELRWGSAGDDNVYLGNLTGSYRIQYATYSAVWSTGTTPAEATTLTIAATIGRVTAMTEPSNVYVQSEETRIKSVYAQRQGAFRYSWFNPGQVFRVHELERGILAILKAKLFGDLHDKEVLEV